MSRKAIVGVMGPDSQSEANSSTAFALGVAIAEAGYLLLTGGRNRGVMHEGKASMLHIHNFKFSRYL